MAQDTALPPLSLKVKLAYGTGELAASIPASIAAFFMLYFFSTVAGLSPALAGGVFLIGRIWDGFNDPLIGWLSDRTHSSLGRRYPWMLLGVLPLAILFALLWIVPPLASESGLFIYYVCISLGLSAAMTAVQLPFTALAAELSEDYDERTSLMGTKSAFSLAGSILGMGLSQLIFAYWPNPETSYLLLGVLSGCISILSIGICVLGTYRRYWQIQQYRRLGATVPRPTANSPMAQLRGILINPIFRTILGLYLCAWVGVQITAAMLPYFVDAWMRLPEIHFAQMALAVQSTAIVAILGWNWLGKRHDKRTIFLAGAPLAALSLLGLILVQPEQIGFMYILGFFAGIGIATLYMVPFAMLPDVIDLDELTTGQRREGLYFSAVVFLQKLGLAIALFMSGQIIDWTGFTANVETQPDQALWAIRLLIGPIPAMMILGSLVFALYYPISRQRHRQVLLQLQQRRQGYSRSPMDNLGPSHRH